MKKLKISSKGFTLLELLVVVLIIGILASIALPQYQMAVTKAKVASILPIMRRFKDALYEYKLQHGSYDDLEDTSVLGVNWPSDWKYNSNTPCGDNIGCYNDYWTCDIGDDDGSVICNHLRDENDSFFISIHQPNDPTWADKIVCYTEEDESIKICKALGGKLIDDYGGYDYAYSLN